MDDLDLDVVSSGGSVLHLMYGIYISTMSRERTRQHSAAASRGQLNVSLAYEDKRHSCSPFHTSALRLTYDHDSVTLGISTESFDVAG